jgi:hypothetical protein
MTFGFLSFNYFSAIWLKLEAFFVVGEWKNQGKEVERKKDGMSDRKK